MEFIKTMIGHDFQMFSRKAPMTDFTQNEIEFIRIIPNILLYLNNIILLPRLQKEYDQMMVLPVLAVE